MNKKKSMPLLCLLTLKESAKNLAKCSSWPSEWHFLRRRHHPSPLHTLQNQAGAGAPCSAKQLPSSDCLHMVVCGCQFWSLSSSHPLFPTLCPQVCSLHLYLYSFTANIFISTIFLDSIYVLIYNICFLCHYHFNKSFLLIHFLLTCHLKTIEFFFLYLANFLF